MKGNCKKCKYHLSEALKKLKEYENKNTQKEIEKCKKINIELNKIIDNYIINDQ